jgi:hypothetical protein
VNKIETIRIKERRRMGKKIKSIKILRSGDEDGVAPVGNGQG